MKGLLMKYRDDRIRTCGPFVPNEVRYQAALHPASLSLEVLVRKIEVVTDIWKRPHS